MSAGGSTRSSRQYDRSNSAAASVPEGRSPLERIRSLERKRNIERRREQFRREQGLEASQAQTRMSIGERVRAELKKLLSRTTEDVSDEEGETDSDSEEGVRRGGGNPGVGILWRVSFCATVTLFAYVFLSAPRVQVNFVPDIVERDPIPRISKPRNRRPRANT